MDAENTYGSSFYNTLSRDLMAALPDSKGFSPTNLKYMRRFYQLYENRPQVGGHLPEEETLTKRPQVADDFRNMPLWLMIPWGHHRLILDKCKADQQKALFYVEQTLKNNWSRAVLHCFNHPNPALAFAKEQG